MDEIKYVGKENVSYCVNGDIADDFEEYLNMNKIPVHASVNGTDKTFIVDKKHADEADEFFKQYT
ncbi:hypothetical protein [Methanosarcina mazei]|uniref:hypothetical protein n=1 Tax=Methanosarcina mazei TaxID=2209 RepID=UPI00064E6E6B|nr:hypothetical protein [Methanosarcina mazei]